MRLIDADKLDFSKVFVGNSEFAKDLRAAAQELIDMQPIAFDKKSVLDDLEALEESASKNMDDDAAMAYTYAIGIVEKGGIE